MDYLHELTKIDMWFLHKMKNIINWHLILNESKDDTICPFMMLRAKQLGFSDKQIAKSMQTSEMAVRRRRCSMGIRPFIKQIDTVAAEWPASTNYLFLTYNGSGHDVAFEANVHTMVIGSGVRKNA